MFNPQGHPCPIFSAIILSACLILAGTASAAPFITLSKKSGLPTTRILVSGRGFEPNGGVDIYLDTKDEALIVTDGHGEFKNAGIRAPRTAPPGKHWVTALERNNDKGAQEPFLVQTNWSQFHFSVDREGLNPYENVLNPRTVKGIGRKWGYATANGAWGSPVVVDGVAYAENSTTLYALNTRTGALRWKFSPPYGELLSSDPAVANGVLYFGTFGGGVYALNAETGVTLWSYACGRPYCTVFSSPAVADGVVYFEDGEDDTGDGTYALDARTGKQLWFSPTNSSVGSSPAVANGVVYVGSDDDNVYALDAQTGAKLWNYATGWVVRTVPAVADGVVYVGSYDDNVYALNAETGALLWKYTAGDSVSSSPAVANGAVYFGSLDDKVYALNASTGTLLWDYTTGDRVWSSPAVANGIVYFGSLDGNVYALNASTGVLLWRYTTGGYVWSSPAVVDGTVFADSDDDNVYAFALPAREGPTGQASSPPGLATLRPDLSLKASRPAATPPSN